MQNQYSRTQLLLGAEAMEKLHNSRVAVFGIGGVGGYTVEALARSGVGALDLIDDDKVCLTNLNRRSSPPQYGRQYKVDVAAQRIHDIDPDIRVTTHRCSLARKHRTSSTLPSTTMWWMPLTPLPASWRW